MWQNKHGSWEYVAVDEPEGQIVVKNVEPAPGTVLLDEPEGQIVVKARKGRKAKKNPN